MKKTSFVCNFYPIKTQITTTIALIIINCNIIMNKFRSWLKLNNAFFLCLKMNKMNLQIYKPLFKNHFKVLKTHFIVRKSPFTFLWN